MDTARAITPRDIKIFQLIYSYDACSADHICTRFFGGRAQRACYGRLAKLIRAGYLRGHRLAALSGIGSGKRLLELTARGRAALAEDLEISPSELRRPRELETPHAGAHHLAICDVRVSLELACERAFGLTLEWTGERELRAPPVRRIADPRARADDGPRPDIPLIADGRFTLALPDGAAQTFELEVDLGTIPAKRMLTKLSGYLALSHKSPILVLWVVPDRKRLEAIANWALLLSRELEIDPSIFWITTKAQITPQGVLSPIWQVIGGPEGHSLIPGALEAPRQPPADNHGEAGFAGGGLPWRS